VTRFLKSEKLLSELEDVAGRLFSEVRHEQGRFQTGVCVLQGRSILIINRWQPLDERIAALSQAISNAGAEKLYLKPVIRSELEKYASDRTVVNSI